MSRYILSVLIVCLIGICNKVSFSNTTKQTENYNYAIKQMETGNYFYSNCHFSEAINSYINALKSLDSINTTCKTDSLYGIIYQQISDVFSDCERYETAKELGFLALKYSRNANDSLNIATCYRKIGNLCYYLSEVDNPDTLLYYLQNSLPYAKGEDPYYSALYMALIGIYKEKEDNSLFMSVRGNGITLLPKDFNERLPYLNNYIAWCLWLLGKSNEAIIYAEKNVESNNIKQQLDAFNLLGKLYLEVGDTTAAIINSKKLDSLNIILSEAKRKASGIEKTYRQYETEKASHIITLNTEKPFITIGWVVGIVLLVLVVLIFMLNLQRKRKKTEKISKLFSKHWNEFESDEIHQIIIDKCASELDLTATNVSTSMICMSGKEWKALKNAFDKYFNGFIQKLKEQYPELNEGELEYILISVFDLSEVQKAALLGLSYQGCISRRNRVQNKLNTCDIQNFLFNTLKT